MFDVVITTRKRTEMLLAAIKSCLIQGEALHKVIVVFDPDDDETAAFRSSIHDPRVVFHCLTERGGICGARRAGFTIADAEWTMHIDDDWELRPGALAKLATMASQASKDVVILGARILWDDGHETPIRVPDQPIDYVEQLKWRNRPDGIGTDNLCSLHRKVRDSGVNWMPEWAGGPAETKFYLDAARFGSTWYTSDLLALEKTTPESCQRGTWERRLAQRKIDAPSFLRSLVALSESHGPGLRKHGRGVYGRCLLLGARSELLLGRQMESVRLASRAFVYDPTRTTLAMLLMALSGRRCFEIAYRIRG